MLGVAVPPKPKGRWIPALLQAPVQETENRLGLKLGLRGGDALIQEGNARHEQPVLLPSDLSQASAAATHWYSATSFATPSGTFPRQGRPSHTCG